MFQMIVQVEEFFGYTYFVTFNSLFDLIEWASPKNLTHTSEMALRRSS